jgi:hypothetical protein
MRHAVSALRDRGLGARGIPSRAAGAGGFGCGGGRDDDDDDGGERGEDIASLRAFSTSKSIRLA